MIKYKAIMHAHGKNYKGGVLQSIPTIIPNLTKHMKNINTTDRVPTVK